jgi:DNA-binding NarL/FixJ family response regulator
MQIFTQSNRIILADPDAIFRAGAAKILAMDENMRIVAQCKNLDSMYQAIMTFPGAIVLCASSLKPDLSRLRMLLDATGSSGIVIAENNEMADHYLQQGLSGVVFRSADELTLVNCVHRVAAGDVFPDVPLLHQDLVGVRATSTRSRDLLTLKEMQVMSSIQLGLCAGPSIGVGEMGMPFEHHRECRI